MIIINNLALKIIIIIIFIIQEDEPTYMQTI
jgi:hypothetical protein